MSQTPARHWPARHWIAVASADHVSRGRAGGFMQVCHGKEGPLKRIKPGDGIVYYSPTQVFGTRTPLQSFTAIGVAGDGTPFPFDMGGGFIPFRRSLVWCPSQPAAIGPLLQALALTRGRRNWGQPFRYGLVQISAADFAVIATAMAASLAAPGQVCAA